MKKAAAVLLVVPLAGSVFLAGCGGSNSPRFPLEHRVPLEHDPLLVNVDSRAAYLSSARFHDESLR